MRLSSAAPAAAHETRGISYFLNSGNFDFAIRIDRNHSAARAGVQNTASIRNKTSKSSGSVVKNCDCAARSLMLASKAPTTMMFGIASNVIQIKEKAFRALFKVKACALAA
jgi:hypothetical protein